MKSIWEVYEEIFMKYFPKLRRSQIEILKRYEKIRNGRKIIEIEAPPGTGKSLINMIIALAEEDNWKNVYYKIVVSSYSKALQYQYAREFHKILEEHDIPVSIGLGVNSFICRKFNKKVPHCIASLGYPCKYFPKIYEGSYRELLKLINEDPNVAFFGFWLPFVFKNQNIKIKALKSDILCDYWKNEYSVFQSKVVFANHHYLIYHLILNESLPVPSVLVIDEAHNFPDILSQSLTLYIGDSLLSFLIENKIINSKSDIIQHNLDFEGLINFVDFMNNLQDNLSSLLSSTKGSLRLHLMDLINITKTYKIILDYAEKVGDPIEKYFLLSVGDSYVIITPTYYAYFAILDYLSTFIKGKIILSSATLPPKDKTPGEIRLYSEKDMYKPEQRLVLYLEDAPKISNNTIATPEVQTYIINLIRSIWKFKNFRKIVIHSINNFIRDYLGTILQKVGFPVVITENLHEDLEKWMNMKEGIIISAGLEEGVDLKYDIARVQIVLKIPWFDTRKDPFMMFLIKYDKKLYNYYVARRMVQIAGRICRARDDAGLTIILDKRALNHFVRHNEVYPMYYKKAVRIVTTPMLPIIFTNFDLLVSEIKRKQKIYGIADLSLSEMGIDFKLPILAWSIAKKYFKKD